MTPKQRILSAINHKTPDRVPHDLRVVPELAEQLCDLLDAPDYEHVQARLGVDLRSVCPQFEGPLELGPRRRDFGDGTWQDMWGLRYRTMSNIAGGVHHEVVSHPLAGAATAADVERYPWPSVDECYNFDPVPAFCAQHADYALVGGFAHFYCPGADLRGYENWLIDLAQDSPVARAMLEHMEAFWLEYTNRLHAAAAGALDIFFLADDYGMQDRMLLSPTTWRRMFKPILTRFIDQAHSRDLPVCIHSCGNVRAIIPDLIDIGIDILDPIQPLARDMDPYQLKRHYGRHLCFHGGLDLQQLLPHGTPDQVRAEAHRLTDIMGQDGGYILAPAHEVQADVPPQNIVAAFT